MSEIKKELKQGNIGVKANAISKLTYVSNTVRMLSSLTKVPIYMCMYIYIIYIYIYIEIHFIGHKIECWF